MNVNSFIECKLKQKKISVVTCYDYTFAKILSQTNVQCVLVGDSAAMTVHGFEDTTSATIEMMQLHTAAVKRGLNRKQFLVADLPFLSNRGSLDRLMDASGRLIQAGASAVKLEGVNGNLQYIEHLVGSGIPVMGHLGLTPQYINTIGGYKIQGKTLKQSDLLVEQARQLQQAGCFSLVLECIPAELAQKITQSLSIPTIGIGAGNQTDGQVLVIQDLLGLNNEFCPSFVKQYLQGHQLVKSVINQYCEEVNNQQFPDNSTSF